MVTLISMSEETEKKSLCYDRLDHLKTGIRNHVIT